MNITILTNKDIASLIALNYLYQSLGAAHKLRVYVSAKVGANTTAKLNSSRRPQALDHLAFAEQHLFNNILFPAIKGREAVPIGKLATFDDLTKLGVSISEMSSINCPQGVAQIREDEPELIISIRFGLILKEAILDIPKHGVINLHSGTLPDYRGVMATFRAMFAGDKQISTTLHYIRDATIDTGEIIAKYSVDVNYQASYLANCIALYQGGVASIVCALESLDAGKALNLSPQQAGGNYYSFPSEADINEFAHKGLKLYEHKDLETLSRLFF